MSNVMHLDMNGVLSLLLPKANNDKLVHEFVKAEVAFLVIGGTAVAAHGCRDVAEVDDLDLLIAPTIENGQRLLNALAAAQVPVCIQADTIATPALQIPLKKYFYAELLTPRKGFDFDEMLNRGVSVSAFGLSLKVASVFDLIRMKQDAIIESQKVLTKHETDHARLRAHNVVMTASSCGTDLW